MNQRETGDGQSTLSPDTAQEAGEGATPAQDGRPTLSATHSAAPRVTQSTLSAPVPAAPPESAPRASAAQSTLSADDIPLSYGGLRRFAIFVATLVVGAMLVQALAPTLMLFTIVFLIAMVLNPLVGALERRGIKRGLAVVFILLSLLVTTVLLGWLVVPPLLEEGNKLASKAPQYAKNIQGQVRSLGERYPALDNYLPEIDKLQKEAGGGLEPAQIGTYLKRILSYTFGVVGALFGLVIALLLLVFTLSNPRPLLAGFLSAVPVRHRDAAGRSVARIQEQMTAWAKATLINGVLTGVSTGVLLHFIGVQPALVFGVLAFFGEFVPNIGPLVAAVPALFVALGNGPDKFGLALAAILFVQQVESNVLVPFVMGRSMQLHPVTIVFFALAMGALFGIAGAILAVPMAAIIKVLYDEFYLRPQQVPLDEIEANADKLVAGQLWPGQEALEKADEASGDADEASSRREESPVAPAPDDEESAGAGAGARIY